jgi:hypothetical protein
MGEQELVLEWGREEMADGSVESKGMENEEERAKVWSTSSPQWKSP